MPAVQTQQLATIADLDQGPPQSAAVQALSMFDATTKNTFLRRASGVVLGKYGVRFGRVPGTSFVLVTWGDLTIALVVAIARYMLIAERRGYNDKDAADKAIRAGYDDAMRTLGEIADITNKTPTFDPDATDGSTGYEELGSLSATEGGDLDQADAWTQRTDSAFLRALA